MTSASAKAPSIVQKTYVHSTSKTGTPIRLVKYTFKVTKAVDADWIVTATYFQSGTPLFWKAGTVDTNGVQEDTVGITYTSSGTLLTLNGGTAGVCTGEIWYEDS